MSRCFPFPPPGYEKKLRIEGVTLLAKEKDKETRHKKDKDRYKKEGSEKDKQRSKERRKEKDKEKHKHKDRAKKDAKKRSRYDKSSEGDRANVEKVGSSSPQSSCLQEREQRTGFVDSTTGSQTVRSKRNGADWTEGNSGLDQIGDGPKINNNQSNFPKVAFIFSNGLEQRTVQIGRHTENNVSKSTEAKEMQIHHNGIKKGEKSKYNNGKRHKGEAEICTPQMFGYDGARVDPPKEAAVVRELERRIRDENGVTGSQVGINPNVTIKQKAQNSGKAANGYAISFSQTKGNSRLGNGSNSMENGQKDNNQSKVPKVAIAHHIKVEKRECEVARAAGTSSKASAEGIERNGYSDISAVDNRKKISSKDDGPNKPVQGCDVAGAVGKSKKALVEAIERNGYSGKGVVDTKNKILFKDEGRSKPRVDEKMKEKAYNTVELSKYGQNGSDSTVSSKKNFSFKMGNKSAETFTGKRKESEAIGILHDNETRPQKWQRTVISSQPAAENVRHLKSSTTITLSASQPEPANGFRLDGVEHKPNWTLGAQLPPVPTNSELSVPKVPGNMGSQESSLVSIKPPIIEGNVNGTIGVHGSPPITGKAIKHEQKVHEAVGHQVSAKPPLTVGNVNGTIAAHGSSHVALKPPSTSGKEKCKGKSSSKPLPPHPDTKYLSQILSVPKMEEPTDFDDTEWLFENKLSLSKEGDYNVCHDTDGGEHVWAKAVHFEFADVYALPYVIPC